LDSGKVCTSDGKVKTAFEGALTTIVTTAAKAEGVSFMCSAVPGSRRLESRRRLGAKTMISASITVKGTLGNPLPGSFKTPDDVMTAIVTSITGDSTTLATAYGTDNDDEAFPATFKVTAGTATNIGTVTDAAPAPVPVAATTSAAHMAVATLGTVIACAIATLL